MGPYQSSLSEGLPLGFTRKISPCLHDTRVYNTSGLGQLCNHGQSENGLRGCLGQSKSRAMRGLRHGSGELNH